MCAKNANAERALDLAAQLQATRDPHSSFAQAVNTLKQLLGRCPESTPDESGEERESTLAKIAAASVDDEDEYAGMAEFEAALEAGDEDAPGNSANSQPSGIAKMLAELEELLDAEPSPEMWQLCGTCLVSMQNHLAVSDNPDAAGALEDLELFICSLDEQLS